jgi:ATP-binding cassette subfamily G (WHITE) protein 2 (PDR)
MQPPAGSTCGDYLASYAQAAGGRIYNPLATADCQYCSLTNTDQSLASTNVYYSERWRNYGIGFAYIFFNIFMAVLLYYLIRVRKGSGKSMSEKFAPLLKLFKKDPGEDKTGLTEKKKEAPQAKGGSILPSHNN